MRRFLTFLALIACLGLAAAPSFAADGKDGDDKAKTDLPPMAADKTVDQQMTLGGRLLKYKATVGHITIRDDKGKPIGEVVYTAYTMDGPGRPVTFAVNGGPGASSVYLNLGAIGPKRVAFGAPKPAKRSS
jgi:carboxypeptidase C (cathepsin A)